MTILISITVALSLLFFFGIVMNNRIIAKKNQMIQAFGSIDVYLKKRFDLVPNLVLTAKQYLSHEKEILTRITELRTNADNANNPEKKIEASNELTQVIDGINLNVENYPNLKSDEQFLLLQSELSIMEEQISAARRAYNAGVTSYNNTIEMFPASIIAGIRKDRQAQLLEIPKEQQKEINLNQLLNNN